ncbi:hypothetical protein L3Q72_23055 [Vibrio sp. JC009]|uniref:hypothetical protein n=1 Tax=Vibrio sp. JC009 TaxID=2912314 RepID=UPI0023B0968A|nr:hypothetical protein [Vibrio sp. JC009]WED24112.1 hypothetical protein L3Q72_23055 [Vibrio sp. JC009]
MSNIYKIETYCGSAAKVVANFIEGMNGKSLVQGSAVVTDFNFETDVSLTLLPFITLINDRVTDMDRDLWSKLA